MKAGILFLILIATATSGFSADLHRPLSQMPEACFRYTAEIQSRIGKGPAETFPLSRNKQDKAFINAVKAEAEALATQYWVAQTGEDVTSTESQVKKMKINKAIEAKLGAYVKVILNAADFEFEFYFTNSEEENDSVLLQMAKLTDFQAMPGDSPGVLWFCEGN